MSRRREWVLIALVASVAAAAGIAYNVWRIEPSTVPAKSHSRELIDTRFPDLEGKQQSLSKWRGNVLVVNFWATWCPPCREEIPIFVRFQKEYSERGLQFVGIAVDQAVKVRPFAAELGMNFPILLGGLEAIKLMQQLGNRAGVLPFTVVLGRDGAIAAVEVGAINESKLKQLVLPLL